MYSELAWQQDGIQWQVVVDIAESLDFLVQILMDDFQSHLTELMLEIRKDKNRHTISI